MVKKIRVGFIGSYSADAIILANNEAEAKRKFAKKHNVVVSSYIVVRRRKK